MVEEWLGLLGGIAGDDLKAAQSWDALAGGRPALIVGADGAVDPLASVGCLEWTRMAGATAQMFPASSGEMAAPVLAVARVRKSEPVKEVSPLTGAPLLGLLDPSTGMNWSKVPELSRLMLRWARQARPGLMSGMSDREIFSAIQDPADSMTVRIRLAWDALPESERARAREGSFVQGGRQTAVAQPAHAAASAPDVEAFRVFQRPDASRVLREGIALDFADTDELRLLVRDVAPRSVARIEWQGSLEMSAFVMIDYFVRSGSYASLHALVQRWSERYPHGDGIASVLRMLS